MGNNVIMLVSNNERDSHRTASVDTMTQNNSEPDQWAALLHQVGQHRDRQAYVALFGHFAPKLKAYGLSTQGVAGVSAFADELVQETMIKVWNRAMAYDQEKAGASTWIFAIARNSRIDLLRRGARHTSHLDADDVWLEAEPDAAPERSYEADRARS